MAAPSSTSSAVQLQAHYDEICSQMQVLPLSILPKALAATLTSLDAAAAKLARHAASGLTECQVCSCTRLPDQLQLQFTTNLDFHTRAVHATAARFVCGQCAAVSSCSLLLQLLTPHAGAEPDEQRCVGCGSASSSFEHTARGPPAYRKQRMHTCGSQSAQHVM